MTSVIPYSMLYFVHKYFVIFEACRLFGHKIIFYKPIFGFLTHASPMNTNCYAQKPMQCFGLSFHSITATIQNALKCHVFRCRFHNRTLFTFRAYFVCAVPFAAAATSSFSYSERRQPLNAIQAPYVLHKSLINVSHCIAEAKASFSRVFVC